MVLVRQERGLPLKNKLNIVLPLGLGMVLSCIRILSPLMHQNKPFEMQQADLFLHLQGRTNLRQENNIDYLYLKIKDLKHRLPLRGVFLRLLKNDKDLLVEAR